MLIDESDLDRWSQLVSELERHLPLPAQGGGELDVGVMFAGLTVMTFSYENESLRSVSARNGSPTLTLAFESSQDAQAFVMQVGSPHDRLRSVQYCADRRRPHPLDLLESTALRSLPAMAGVSFVWQQHLEASAAGDISHYFCFEDGRLTSAGLGEHKSPDLTLSLTYRDAMRVRRQMISPLECITGAEFDGDLATAMMILGFLSEKPVKDAVMLETDDAISFGDLGLLWAQAPHTGMLGEVRHGFGW